MYPNIKAEMGRRNLTIKQLADILGMSATKVSNKLKGKCEFTLFEIEQIATLFNCSLDYLVSQDVLYPAIIKSKSCRICEFMYLK